MVEEQLPEVLNIGEIKLTPGEAFYYEAWGFRYRYKAGDWRIAQMAFRRKADAESWMKDKFLRFEGMEGEVIPVVSGLLLTGMGDTRTYVAEDIESCKKGLGVED